MSTLNIAMIGLDTSHCEAFADLLHNAENPYYVPGTRIVKAFPGGSQAFSNSRNRVERITGAIAEKYGVTITETLAEAVDGVDAVLLESVDGRQHLEQFAAIAPLGLPVYIDKPMACSYADAAAIQALSEKHGSPIYTCSSIRYAAGVQTLGAASEITSCTAFGPLALLDDYPGSFWYGIHSAEVLFSKMGRGCTHVLTRQGESSDFLVGTWADGRLGTVQGLRMKSGAQFGCLLQTSDGPKFSPALSDPPYYATMMPHIVQFFRTGKPPIDPLESLEIVAFLDAADRSRSSGVAELVYPA